jgi:ligand-binding sensor domain-containing protein
VEEEDVEAVTVDPASGRVWIGTFNGLFVSDDGGSSWREDHEGLPLRDIRALAVAGQPARLWVGFAGGSVVSRPLE